MTHPGNANHPNSGVANSRRTARAVENVARMELAKREENGQIVSIRQEVAADGGTFNMHLKNPTDSATDANISLIKVSSTFEGIFNVYDGFSSAPSGGTSQDPDNLLMDSENTNGGGAMEVYTNVSYTSNKTHAEGVIPSGGSEKEPVGGVSEATQPLIQPGREIVVEMVNDSANPKNGAITLVWSEEQ